MSEYSYVEKPFLDQLSALGWQVIDQGNAIPTDPTLSHRTSFREVTLGEVFKQSVKSINTTSDGQEWLTDEQLEDLYEEVLDPSGNNLLEKNQNLLHFLLRDSEWKPTVDENELTGEQNPEVKLIDFDHPERNHFLAMLLPPIQWTKPANSFIAIVTNEKKPMRLVSKKVNHVYSTPIN